MEAGTRAAVRQVTASSLVTLGLLCVGELAMRATDWPDPGLYRGDRAWVWWLRPSLDRPVTDPLTQRTFQVQTDPSGLRGRSPPSHGAWTLALGCSTTFGWAVEANEAWPAKLEALVGEPVVNGGVPGWSSAQAARGVAPLLELGPSRVVLAFGVRDAQRASRPDASARPTPWLLQSRWALLLGRAHAQQNARAAGDSVARVGPAAFAENLQWVVERVEQAGAEPVVLFFPQPGAWPPDGYVDALEDVPATAWVPHLPAGAFFADDPIHLTEEGHAQLARWLAPRWKP